MYKLETIVREKQTKSGHKFNTYAVKEKGTEKWVTLKFTKDVPASDIPVSHSYVFVDKEYLSKDTRDKYPVYWIKKIESVEVIPVTPQDLSEFFEEC